MAKMKSKEGLCIDCGASSLYEHSFSLCIKCHVARSNRYHTQSYRFRKYGITREWYVEQCKQGCSICKRELDPYSLIKRDRGHIDHDHQTLKVRGVLCDLCNKGLGQFKDSISLLENAINYLKEENDHRV